MVVVPPSTEVVDDLPARLRPASQMSLADVLTADLTRFEAVAGADPTVAELLCLCRGALYLLAQQSDTRTIGSASSRG